MLEEMRQHSHSWIIYLLFGILICVFAISFGPGSRGCYGGGNSINAATVNGEGISDDDFARLYHRYYNYLSNIYPGFSEEQAKKMNLRQTVLDELINHELLVQEAVKRGLVVTDEELRYAIVNDVQFQNEGKFDKEYYNNFVTRYLGISVARFEEQKRKDILAQKVESLFVDSIAVSEQELVNEYKIQNDKVRAAFVTFSADAKGGDAISDDEAQKAVESNLEAVKAFHQKNFFRYRGQRRVSVSRILVPLAEDADEAAMETASAATKEIRAKLAAGGDFAALAKEFSKGPEAAKGGSMGWVAEDISNFPILRAVANVAAGELVAQDVVTQDGLNIVRVDEIDIPKTKEFDEIKVAVAKDMLAEQRAQEQAKTAAEAWLAKAVDGSSLNAITTENEELATNEVPFVEKSEWVTRDSKAVTGLGINQELINALFAEQGTNKVINKVFSVGSRFAAVWVIDRQAPDMGKYDEERDLIKGSLRETKRRQMHDSWIKELRANAKISIREGRGSAEEFGNF